MNEGRDVWSGGTMPERSAQINKSMRTSLGLLVSLFPKKTPLTENEEMEKLVEEAQVRVDKARSERNFRGSPSAIEKSSQSEDAEGRLDKEVVVQILKDGGWDKLPMSDKAKGVIEDAISKGAKPVTEYTGKLLVEHGIAEEPPAFLRPKKLKVGDRVVPLQWASMGVHGAQFDLQSVPAAMKVKKMYTGPAKVTKCAYPPGRGPSDILKCDTVIEDRMWGMDLEPEDVKKSADSNGHETSSVPVRTSDTTMVLRLEPLASPQGEVRS